MEGDRFTRWVPHIIILQAIVAVAFLASGCGKIERGTAALKGYSTMCVDGVKYIQFTSGASVKYNPDGTLVTC